MDGAVERWRRRRRSRGCSCRSRGAAEGEAGGATEVVVEMLAAGPETGRYPPSPEHQQPPPVSPRAEIVREGGPVPTPYQAVPARPAESGRQRHLAAHHQTGRPDAVSAPGPPTPLILEGGPFLLLWVCVVGAVCEVKLYKCGRLLGSRLELHCCICFLCNIVFLLILHLLLV